MAQTEIVLRLSECPARDVEAGSVRINSQYARSMRLRSGDCVLIKNPTNGKSIVGIYIFRTEDQDDITIDSRLREQIGVALGEPIIIQKIDVPSAESVIIAPIGIHASNASVISELIEGKIVKEGVIINVNRLNFRVMNTDPSQWVTIDSTTSISMVLSI